MANTYTQYYLHFVFSPKYREALIHKSWKENLEKYITHVVQNHEHKLLAIYAMPDHIHILIGYDANQKIPDLIQIIKNSSNIWIKENKFSKFKFDWQLGYGGFSHSKAELNKVINYIRNQESHHKKKSFKEEYLEILKRTEIDYKDEYLFDFFENINLEII